jgi:hypothetical protein
MPLEASAVPPRIKASMRLFRGHFAAERPRARLQPAIRGGCRRGGDGNYVSTSVAVNALRAFVDAGVRYLLSSGLKLDGEESALGTVRADYEPLALTVSFGWKF